MSPDEICAVIERSYAALTREARTSPNGWSFFYGPKRGSAQSNRILRATRSSPTAPTRLKLPVTSRLTEDLELTFQGDEDELGYLIDREIRLWRAHFEKSA